MQFAVNVTIKGAIEEKDHLAAIACWVLFDTLIAILFSFRSLVLGFSVDVCGMKSSE